MPECRGVGSAITSVSAAVAGLALFEHTGGAQAINDMRAGLAANSRGAAVVCAPHEAAGYARGRSTVDAAIASSTWPATDIG